MEQLPVFRTSKKRKIVRLKKEEGEVELPQDDQDTVVKAGDEGSDGGSELTKVVRARKPTRTLKSGPIFSAALRPSSNDDESTSLVLTDRSGDELKDMSNRFVGSTIGQSIDVDQHMIAYIDSEMAKRRQTEVALTNTNDSSAMTQSTYQSPPLSKGIPAATTSQQHQLAEVDLASIPIPTRGPSKLAPLRTPRKPRLGRDGKPLRPRPRKHRNSEDIARDALVEQVLHEHKLVDMSLSSGLNSDPQAHSDSEEAATGGTRGSGDADEAFAERFRQDFLDRVAERQLAQQQKKSAPGTATAEKGQGPRLGGSRSARAKMAAMQQQQGPAGQK